MGWAAAAQPCPAGDAALETRLLFGADSAKTWSVAESTLASSGERVKTSQASLHWHVTVDYHAGEVKYPIGWPRVSHAIPEESRDWSDWEFLQMWIYTETSREGLPRDPVGLGLHTPDKASAYHQPLAELRKGEWVKLAIPIAGIPRCGDVRQIQFHIAESNYRHGDTLDLFIDGLALVRHATPVLAEFAPETPVVFGDARYLPLRLQVLGVKGAELAGIDCELRGQGRAVASGHWEVARGPQRCVLDWGPGPLAPGAYELVARTASSPSPAGSSLRVVASPWETGKKEGKP